MFYFSKVPLLRLLLPFVLGIIGIKQLINQAFQGIFIAIVGLCFLSILLVFFYQKNTSSQYSKRWLFGVFSTLGLFFAGMTYSTQFDNKRDIAHFDTLGQVTWVGEVLKMEDNKDSSYNYQVKVLSVQSKANWEDTQFSMLIFSKKPNLIFHEGEIISGTGYLNLIERPLNPKQFNFKEFSANRGIFYRTYENEFYVHGKHKSINSIAAKFRKILIGGYAEMGIRNNELAVLTALTLGDKSQLNTELKNNYADAGAMHVLAVSGLHVGIIYLLFSQLFKSFDKKWWQRIMKAILLLVIVWTYAILTGFSPSVQRAACMFSFIIISSSIQRHSNIINSIAGSALLLILINPNIVFEVGFQLSYLAVVGIVLIHPAIYPIFSSKYWLIDRAWSLIVVSIAAQLATFPLTIYYFHQFPNWFLLVNVFVIPLAFIIVSGALITMTIWGVFQHDFYLAEILDWTLRLLNYLIDISQKLPYATTEGVWLSNLSMVLLFVAMAAFVYFILVKKAKLFVLCLSILTAIFLVESFKSVLQVSKSYIGIYDFNNLTMCFVNGLKAEVFSSNMELNCYEQKIVEQHLTSEGVREINWKNGNTLHVKPTLFQITSFGENVLISGLNKQFVIVNKAIGIAALQDIGFIFLLNNEQLKLHQELFTEKAKKLIFLPKIKPWSQEHLDFEKSHPVYYMSKKGYFQVNSR